jgi:hypothetical protein
VDDADLTPEDDQFHPGDDNPWWTETVWFAWMIPEHNMLGYFYPAFRKNLGVHFGGALVVDHTAELPWELPFFDYNWHCALPPDTDLRHFDLESGMRLRVIEPMRVFEFGYSHRDLELELRYEAIMRPMVSRATPPFNKGHIDQPGRVTGHMVLHGQRYEVDCYAMRDRSWGPRQDGRQPKVGYAYGIASPTSAFLSVSIDKSGHDGVAGGFLMRDGEWSRLRDGERQVVRDDRGRPETITIRATDELGRPVEAVGSVLSRQVFTAYPSMFCWNSLVRWTFDDGVCHGEDQDVMHPRRWRDFVAGKRPL